MSKEYFDKVAGQWDEMRQDFFSEQVRDRALEIACLQQGKVAADIGAGTGFMTEGLLGFGFQVIAVDQSQEMICTIQNKFRDKGIDCRVGEADKIPISDASIDYAFANMYLHHVESPLMAIKEIARILKPEGRIIITDLDIHQFEFLRTEQHDRWMGFNRDELTQWYLDAGFGFVFIDDVGTNCCTTSECGCHNANISMFVAMGMK